MNTEGELIANCLRGDANAWDQLFDLHYSSTTRFVFQLAPDLTVEDIEEIGQECFLSVIRNLRKFGGASRLSTWIFRIAANKTHDHRERLKAAKRGGGRALLSLQATDPVSGSTLDPASPNPGPDASLLREEDIRLVRESLDELEPRCREIIELRFFADLSYEEIGYELHLNAKTVSSRLSRCLDRLEVIAGNLFYDHRGKKKPTTV